MVSPIVILSLAAVCLVGAKPTNDYGSSYQTMSYAQPAYGAPSYDVHDVTKIADYDYAVNDYYGNVQSRQEHVEPGKQIGHWSALMADGATHAVDYEAGAYGNLAHVVVRSNNYGASSYAAPVQTYSAPVQTYSAPVQTYSAPVQTYSAPMQTYSVPMQTYSVPMQTYSVPMQTYSVPMQTYAVPVQTYAAPSYDNDYNNDYNDVKKIVDYDYAVNDYYGNEQSRQEHVEPEVKVGTWTARMANGALESVDYQAGAYGNLAHVVVSNNYGSSYNGPQHYVHKRSASYGPAAHSYAAPSYGSQAPKMHYNYEEQNIYVPQTYSAPSYGYQAPQTYARIAPKMHYNYEEKNIYVPQTYSAPSYTALAPSYSSY